MLLQLMPLLRLAATARGVPWPQGSTSQLQYLDNELSMFMHYSICTYNEGCNGGQQNCGFEGKEQPWPASTFDPAGLDTDQWAETARDLGARQVCLTVHHTGAKSLPCTGFHYSPRGSPFTHCHDARIFRRLCALADQCHCVRSQRVSVLRHDGARYRCRVCVERSQT